MKRSRLNNLYLIFFIFFSNLHFSYGQKTEINFNAYCGLFSFHGNGSTSNSSIISYPFASLPTIYTLNSFGSKSEFSYALEFEEKRLSKRKNIYGFGISFEQLTSRVNIYKIGVSGDPAYLEYSAKGKTTLKNTFVTLNPFIGHRYSSGKVAFDLLAGLDLAFCLKSREVGKASTNNKDYVTAENDKTKPSIDFRPRIQIKTQINKLGFLAGYSAGLTNYQTQDNLKAYTGFLRLGCSYQLK